MPIVIKMKGSKEMLNKETITNINNLTDQLKSINTEKEFLNVNEASQFLNLKKSFLYKLSSQKRIRYYKPNNGKIYFKKEDLISYIESNPIYTKLEIEKKSSDYINKK